MELIKEYLAKNGNAGGGKIVLEDNAPAVVQV
jgi:hypothetical protein